MHTCHLLIGLMSLTQVIASGWWPTGKHNHQINFPQHVKCVKLGPGSFQLELDWDYDQLIKLTGGNPEVSGNGRCSTKSVKCYHTQGASISGYPDDKVDMKFKVKDNVPGIGQVYQFSSFSIVSSQQDQRDQASSQEGTFTCTPSDKWWRITTGNKGDRVGQPKEINKPADLI